MTDEVSSAPLDSVPQLAPLSEAALPVETLAHRKFLGITALKFYWDNQHLIPEEWKDLTDGHATLIFFDGTVLRSAHGSDATWYIHWRNGRWKTGYQAITSGRKARYKSVVIVE